MSSSTRGELNKIVGLSIGAAVVMIVLGILAIALPGATGLGVAIAVPWIVMVAGVMHLIYAFAAERAGEALWRVLVAVAYVAGGLFLLVHPGLSLVSLTLTLGCVFLVEGVMRFVLFFEARRLPGSGWILVDAISTLLLGVLIVAGWPASSAWAIGTLLGANLLVSGVTRLMLSVSVRRPLRTAAHA